MIETPVQTNAADEEQVRDATDRESEVERRDLADARAELADYEARRRSFERVDVLFRFSPSTESRLDLGRFLGRHDAAVYLMARWRRHPELCSQMVSEGFKRLADEDKALRAKRVKRST